MYNARKQNHGGQLPKGSHQNDTSLSTAAIVATETGVSRATIKRDGRYAEAVAKVAEGGAIEVLPMGYVGRIFSDARRMPLSRVFDQRDTTSSRRAIQVSGKLMTEEKKTRRQLLPLDRHGEGSCCPARNRQTPRFSEGLLRRIANIERVAMRR